MPEVVDTVGAPLVTIGVPVRDDVEHIAGAMASLLAQDHAAIDVVVSDNASGDGTTEVLRRLAEADDRVRLIVRAEPLTLHGNFKSVLAEAHGRYFMWAAADDRWEPGFVKALVAELEAHPEAGLAMSATRCVWDDGEQGEQVRFLGRDDPNGKGNGALMRSMVSFSKTNYFIYGVYRTEVLRSAIDGFAPVPASDRVLLSQLALVTRFRYVDEPLYVRTLHRRKYHERRPGDEADRPALGARPSAWAVAGALASGILRAKAVPFSRKPYALVAAGRHLRKTLVQSFTNALVPWKDRMPAPLVRWLTAAKRRLAP